MKDFHQYLRHEESLDPTDWVGLRQLAHQALDAMFDLHEGIHDDPAWVQPTPEAKAAMTGPIPQQPATAEAVYANFQQNVLPFPKGNIHPRFFAWVQGTGTPMAIISELLAAGTNPNVAIGDHAAMYVDQQVINWMKEMFNFPSNASGILLSGATMANVTGIQVARNSYPGLEVRKKGLQQVEQQLLLYASAETHSCVQKAAEVAGIGEAGIRYVRVGKDYRLDIDHLEELLAADRAAGHLPFCLVGNAGTVNTGAIDPLEDMLRIARREQMWFHVDGAFGALAKLVPEYQTELAAIEAADSLAFDLHKWMYMPYELGCLLVRDAEAHRKAFALQPNYLLSHERGLAAGPDPVTNFGIELSRGFKALKIWMELQYQGLDKFARLIRQNIAQCFYLGELIEAADDLELLTPVTLNIVCYRFHPAGLAADQINAVNKEILMRLHEEGIASPSYTLLEGRYAIRVAHVNHRTRSSDMELLVKETQRIGQDVMNEIK